MRIMVQLFNELPYTNFGLVNDLTKEIANSFHLETDIVIILSRANDYEFLASSFKKNACKTKSVTTNSDHILEPDSLIQEIKETLKQRAIPVITSYQIEGWCRKENALQIAAVNLAVVLEADLLQIYTKTNGIYTANPKICAQAKRIDKIRYEETQEISGLGLNILSIEAIEIAQEHKLHVQIKSINHETGETTMKEKELFDIVKQEVVKNIKMNKNQTRITVEKVPDRPGIAAKIFSAIKHINVDMIVQSTSRQGFVDITFTVGVIDYEEAIGVTRKTATEINAAGVYGGKDVAKISIIGSSMRYQGGVAAKMFSALAENNINIIMISTSEVKISCIIEEKYTELAVRVLHDAFSLEKK